MKNCFVLTFFAITFLNAQQFQDDDFSFKNEITGGINFNTIAPVIGGVNLKYCRLVKDKQDIFHFFMTELTHVKHPNEVKVSRPGSTSSYVRGKENHFIPLRFLYGRERTLFFKAKDEGVQMNLIYAAGPVLGFEKPYYVLYGPNQDNAQYVRNNASRNDNLIQGQGGLLMGINESNVKYGLSSRLSLNLAFESFRNSVLGVEIGLQVDLYPSEVKILPVAGDRSTFISGFIVGYFGNRW
ncbi:MAG: hypothetical protein SNJ77_02540 [Cytophagales bacterium]